MTLFALYSVSSQSIVYGQKKQFRWIKPADVSSKNYKLAKKLYKSGKYEAGFFTINYKTARKLFRGRRSAIAVETILTSDLLQVPLWQSESHRSKLEINRLSGEVTSARRRRQLLREAKYNAFKWETLKLFKKKIPTRPKTFSVSFQADTKDTIRNLVLVRKGMICKIQPFSNTDGNTYVSPFPDIPLQFSSVPDTVSTPELVSIRHDTLSLRLYYERNEVLLNEVEQHSLQENLRLLQGQVDFIGIIGYASVEGSFAINEKLYLPRAENIKKHIHAAIAFDQDIKIMARENWGMFRHQIHGTEYASLKQQSKEQVRAYVNKHLKDPDIDQWLEEQRYVEVRIVTSKENIIQAACDNPLAYYTNHIHDELKKGSAGSKQLEILEHAQILSYQWYMQGKLSLNAVRAMTIPDKPRYSVLQFNKLIFDFNIGQSDLTESQLFDHLIQLGNERNTPAALKRAIRFNTQSMLFRAVASGRVDQFLDMDRINRKAYQLRIFRLIPSSRSNSKSREPKDRIVMQYFPRFINEHKGSRLSDADVEELYRFYYSYMILSYYYNFYPETRKQALRQLHGIDKYFAEEKLRDNEERLAIARLYMLLSEYDTALKLLHPLMKVPEYSVYATQLSLSCKQYVLLYDNLIEEILASRFDLGYTDWLAMFENPYLLGPRYFDNARIREYYFAR